MAVVWTADTTQPRSSSGSTSPSKFRDALHTAPFYDNTGTTNGTSRSRRTVIPKAYIEEEKENNLFPVPQSFASYDVERGYNKHEKRPSQSTGATTYAGLGAVGAPSSRDGSLPSPHHSEESRQSSPAYQNAFAYPHASRHTPSNSMASALPSSAYTAQPGGSNSRNLTTNMLSNPSTSSNMQFEVAYSQDTQRLNGLAAGRTTGLNPVSQPWDSINNAALHSTSNVIGSSMGATTSNGNHGRAQSHASYSGVPSYTQPIPSHQGVSSDYIPQYADFTARAQPASFRQGQVGQTLNGSPSGSSTGPYGAPQAFPFFQPPYMPLPYGGQGLHQALAQLNLIGPYGVYPPSNGVPLGQPNHRAHENVKAKQSTLLEQYKLLPKNKNKWALSQIAGHVVEFCGDQQGSRFIQFKLDTANSDEKEMLFQELESNAVQLMKDVFGNYVLQKLFEHGSQLQKKALAGQMKGKMVDLSTQSYGCRVVQKVCEITTMMRHLGTNEAQAFDYILVEQQAELVAELAPDILRVIKDTNGNHVIQKVIGLVPRQYIGFIVDAFRGTTADISLHMYGCRVTQRLLEFGTEEDKAFMLEEIHQATPKLCLDAYANYVVQHVLQNGTREDKDKIIKVAMSSLIPWSQQKYASNVLEKCINVATPADRSAIYQQLTAVRADGTDVLLMLIKDQFANYVIQTLVTKLEGQEGDDLVDVVAGHLAALRAQERAGRQSTALDKISNAVQDRLDARSRPTSSGSSTNSAIPVLTPEHGSPQSSGMPSTNTSAAGDVAEGADKN